MEMILDQDRLLEGEDPTTRDLEDAEHWLRVYSELLGFKTNVVGEARASAADLPADARPEARADLTVLRAEQQRLERRHRFWTTRIEELQAR